MSDDPTHEAGMAKLLKELLPGGTADVIARLKRELDKSETALAGLADTINQELRENGGDQFQTHPGEDMRPAVRRLVDCVRRTIAGWRES